MKKKALIFLLALTIILGAAHAAYAAAYPEELAFFSEDTISYVTEYDKNKMPVFFGNGIDATLKMDTTTVFFGNQLNIKGSYENDVIAFGNVITVDADIAGNLYMFSSSATQSGNIGGDLFNFSANFQQATASTVGGTLYAFCSGPRLLGKVTQSAYLFCDDAYISGEIGGNVQGGMNAITIDDPAKIGGFVKYRGENDPVLIGAAQSISFERLPVIKAEPKTFAQKATELVLSALGFAAALLLVYLMFSRLAPAVSGRLNMNLKHRLAAVFGLGCAALLGLPLAVFLLMFISVRAGFALLCMYAFLILISMFVSLVVTFDLVMAKMKNQSYGIRLLLIALTGFVVKLLLEIPVLGPVIGIAGLILGMGLFVSLMLRPVGHKQIGGLENPDDAAKTL